MEVDQICILDTDEDSDPDKDPGEEGDSCIIISDLDDDFVTSKSVHNSVRHNKADAPRPRECHVKIWPDFQGYGFNLHAEKGKPGQVIGHVNKGSPAEYAGLREGDRIIEVNGENIAKDNHREVVKKIKSDPNQTVMLVLDPEAEKYYRERDITVSSTRSNVHSFVCPDSKPQALLFSGGFYSEGSNLQVDNENALNGLDTNRCDSAEHEGSLNQSQVKSTSVIPDTKRKKSQGYNNHCDNQSNIHMSFNSITTSLNSNASNIPLYSKSSGDGHDIKNETIKETLMNGVGESSSVSLLNVESGNAASKSTDPQTKLSNMKSVLKVVEIPIRICILSSDTMTEHEEKTVPNVNINVTSVVKDNEESEFDLDCFMVKPSHVDEVVTRSSESCDKRFERNNQQCVNQTNPINTCTVERVTNQTEILNQNNLPPLTPIPMYQNEIKISNDKIFKHTSNIQNNTLDKCSAEREINLEQNYLHRKTVYQPYRNEMNIPIDKMVKHGSYLQTNPVNKYVAERDFNSLNPNYLPRETVILPYQNNVNILRDNVYNHRTHIQSDIINKCVAEIDMKYTDSLNPNYLPRKTVTQAYQNRVNVSSDEIVKHNRLNIRTNTMNESTVERENRETLIPVYQNKTNISYDKVVKHRPAILHRVSDSNEKLDVRHKSSASVVNVSACIEAANENQKKQSKSDLFEKSADHNFKPVQVIIIDGNVQEIVSDNKVVNKRPIILQSPSPTGAKVYVNPPLNPWCTENMNANRQCIVNMKTKTSSATKHISDNEKETTKRSALGLQIVDGFLCKRRKSDEYLVNEHHNMIDNNRQKLKIITDKNSRVENINKGSTYENKKTPEVIESSDESPIELDSEENHIYNNLPNIGNIVPKIHRNVEEVTKSNTDINNSIEDRQQSDADRYLKQAKEKLNEFKCEVCGMTFKEQLSLNFHMIKHDGNTNFYFPCDYCGKSCLSKRALESHMFMIHAVPSYYDQNNMFVQCNCCRKKMYGSNMNALLQYHIAKVHHQCKNCSKVFNSFKSLREHDLQTHGKLDRSEEYKCNLCSKGVPTKAGLILHIEKDHMCMFSTNNQCNVCGKTFINSRRLQDHIKKKHDRLDY